MPKKLGIGIICLGAALIISAQLLLWHYNAGQDRAAGQQSVAALQEVRAQIPEAGTAAEADAEMTVVEIDGYGYIGYLTIPRLGLELPVMDRWDYARLAIAPCRQYGAAETKDLVIAGHNYKAHFKDLAKLTIGDGVTFTDMDGRVYQYVVARTETVAPTDVDAVHNSGYDLALYTCTPGGRTRAVVFCTPAGGGIGLE